MTKTLGILLFALLLTACASTTAETTGLLAAGTAGIAAVFDALLANGAVTPVQHIQMVQGLHGIDQTVEAAVEAAKLAQAAAASVKAGTLTTGETQGLVGAGLAVLATGLNAYRNVTRAKVVEKITAV